jgi:hypothetical protein
MEIDMTKAEAIGIAGGEMVEIRGYPWIHVIQEDGYLGPMMNEGFFFRDKAELEKWCAWKFDPHRPEGYIPCDTPEFSVMRASDEEGFYRLVKALRRGGYRGYLVIE